MVVESNTYPVAFIPSPVTEAKTYYYIAAGPTVAIDEAAGRRPRMQLDIYRNKEEVSFYALLQFTAELFVSREVAVAAAQEQGLEYDTLLPIQPLGAALTVTLPKLLEPVTLPAAIGGKNVAIFSTSLQDPIKIQLLETLLADPNSTPIGLSYQINYLTTMPPSKFQITAEYEQVYSYLKEAFGFDFLVVQANFENIYSELEGKQIVKVEIVEGSGDWHKQINTELTNMILTSFFDPIYEVPSDPVDSPKFGFYLRKTIVEDQKFGSLSAKIAETAVVQRSVFPQNTFSEFVAGSDYQVDKVIHKYDIKDDFFKDREMLIHLVDEGIAEGISSVNVHLKYGTDEKQIIFTKEDLKPKLYKTKAILDPGGKMIWPVSYYFEVNFVQPGLEVSQVSSAEMVTEGTQLYLNLDSLLANYHFDIKPFPNFNWEWFTSVQAKLIAFNNANDQLEKIFKVYPPGHTTFQHSWLLPYSDKDQFRFKTEYTYEPKSNRHLPGPIERPVNQLVMVPIAAFPQRQLTIEQNYDWEYLDQVILTVFFQYCENATSKQAFTFENDSPKSVFFSADQPDTNYKTIQLKVEAIPKKGPITPYNYNTKADFFELPKLEI